MNCNNGELYRMNLEEAERELEINRRSIIRGTFEKELIVITDDEYEELLPLPRPMRKNKMRNKPCICGSGIKFKRCCWHKYTQTHQ